MKLDLDDDQVAFRDTVRKFIQAEVPLPAIRELYDRPEGFDRDWWRQAAELGWTSMFVADDHGGGSLSGRPVTDAVIIAEEMGRMLSPGPFLPVNVVAAGVSRDGSDAQQGALLPGLLSGQEFAAWAFSEPGGRWDAGGVSTSATPDGDGIVLDGTKAFVEAVAAASQVLITAQTDGEPTQVLVPVDTPGVRVTPGRSVDMTRRFGAIHFNDVRLPIDAVVGSVGGAAATVQYQLSVALALQCAELVGIADRTLEMTLEYGRDRFAFGRPIVSFQALKHRIADMAQWLETSMATADSLATAIDDGDDTSRLASVAKAYVGDKVPLIVDDCVQITGGIGVTWEHDIHMYNRRAVVSRAVYGSPAEHKEQLFSLLASELEATR